MIEGLISSFIYMWVLMFEGQTKFIAGVPGSDKVTKGS